jgi:HK97 family phage major capsid protein
MEAVKEDSEYTVKCDRLNAELKQLGRSELSGKQIDAARTAVKHYLAFGDKALSSEQWKDINTVVNPAGGFLLMPERGTTVHRPADSIYGVYANIPKITSMGSPYQELKDAADYNKSDFYHELANAPTANVTPALGTIDWYPQIQSVAVEFSRISLEDIAGIEQNVLGKVQFEMDQKAAAQVTLGNGVQRPRGILTYASGTTMDTINQVDSASSGAFSWADVLKTLPSALNEAYAAMAKMYMNRSTFFSLLGSLDAASQYPIMNQVNFFSATGMGFQLLGTPVVFDASIPSINTGALSVLYGDLGSAYKLVSRPGMAIHRNESSAQSVTVTLSRRFDAKLTNGTAAVILKIK